MRVTRRGTTLAELVVALALGVFIVGLCARALVVQRRAERTTASASRPGSAADEAVRVVASALARIASMDTVWARGDTALEWRAPVGAALACAGASDSLVVPDVAAGAWWESAPDSGDAAEVVADDGTWSRHEIVAVRSRTNGACGAPQRTLMLGSFLSGTTGHLVRVTRRMRFMLYRGGDGLWWLGQRICSYADPVRCDPAQPIAGPLLPPPAGITFAMDSAAVRTLITVTARAGRATRAAAVGIHP